MFLCPLFCEFHELNKTAKLKGTKIDTIPNLIGKVYCVVIVWFEFAKVKAEKIILHMKSSTFRAANLKGFTVVLVKWFWAAGIKSSAVTLL